MRNKKNLMILGVAVLVALSMGMAQATTVSAFATTPTDREWYQSDVRPGGSASIVGLNGVLGNLELSQPLPTNGAALLTTDMTNTAKAEVSVRDAYGLAGDILSSLTLSYDYYRSNWTGGNTAAAPSLKLTFLNSAYQGDGYVTLVYEPYWQTGAAIDPTPDVWTSVDIDFDTGKFWQNGGFGQANSGGGPPLKTLEGWLGAFDDGFKNASLFAVSMGVGTYNTGQFGYFDDVQIKHSSYSAVYDFGLVPPVPEPASLSLLGLGLAGLAVRGIRRKIQS